MTHEEPVSRARPTPPGTPAPGEGAPTDEDFLRQYVERRDELAFAHLVRRFGPLVFGVCRRVLGHQQDAEDAFQATFLVLARKAGAIRKGQATAAFLCRVAYRIAKKQRRQKARRSMVHSDLSNVPDREQLPAVLWQDLRPALDEEVDRLPGKLRLPFVLCYLDGLSYEQAAQQLGCPVGTLGSWLSRARALLRGRLARRGLALSSGLLATVLAGYARAVHPPLALLTATVRHSARFATGHGLASTTATELATDYLRASSRLQLARRATAILALGVGLALLSFGLWRWLAGSPPAPPSPADLVRFQGAWDVLNLAVGGQQVPPGALRQVVFEGNAATFLTADGAAFRMTFVLNPAATPKQIDLTLFLPGPTPGQGVYELAGDELRICYTMRDATRPAALVSRVGTQETLYHIRRARP